MIAHLINISLDMDGKCQIILSVPRDQADDILALRNETLDVAIAKHRDKRSRNANAYLWEIIGKLADKLRMNKEECYLEMIKRYGQGALVSVPSSNWPMVRRGMKYYQVKGCGTANGIKFTHVYMWVGSSDYNTLEMTVLIDGVVSECREQGIDTDTPQQIMLMDERHRQKYG